MFKKLRNSLLLVNMVIITLVMLAAFVAIYFITYTNAMKENKNKLESMGTYDVQVDAFQYVDDTGKPIDDGSVVSQVVEIGSLSVDYNTSFLLSIDENGDNVEVLSYLDLPKSAYDEALKVWNDGEDGESGVITLEGRKWQYLITKYTDSYLDVSDTSSQTIEMQNNQIGFLDITDTNDMLKSLLITFVIVGVLMLAMLFALSMWVSNRSIRPIEENWIKQRQFVADASHELKTPLAIIDANLDALRSSREETVDSQMKWIDYAGVETHRMTNLINDMLYLAKSEMAEVEMMPIDLSEVIEDAVASMEAVAYEKGVVISKALARGIVVNGDIDRVKQVILILLENALKYTQPNGKVDISLEQFKHQTMLVVKNSGVDITDEGLTRVFDRFYRCDPSRSGETGGHGLGLSIAKAIVERMEGKISAKSNAGTTEFIVTFKVH